MHTGLNALLSITGFAARHFLVVALGAAFFCILWTFLYICLLIYAMISGGGLGGPLAYPAGIIGIILGSIVIGWGIFAPASGLGVICCRLFKLPKIVAIPVVFVSAYVLSHLLYSVFIASATTHSMPSSWVVMKNFSLFLAVPLGAYWWLTEGPGAIIDAVRRILAKRRFKSTLPCRLNSDS